jgi:hypothetical protein
MPEAKPDRSAMTDRELLLSLHERLDDEEAWRRRTDRRLAEGDVEIGMCLEGVRTLCTMRGAEEAAGQLGAYLAEKRERLATQNGTDHDTPTNPGNDRPAPDAE